MTSQEELPFGALKLAADNNKLEEVKRLVEEKMYLLINLTSMVILLCIQLPRKAETKL